MTTAMHLILPALIALCAACCFAERWSSRRLGPLGLGIAFALIALALV
jgi:hypothetical protein